jgi:REP element-mobilizing transposase RayT
MARLPRRKQINEHEVGIYHCWNGCVQQRWLLGRDKQSGKPFGHRKRWVERELKRLAKGFAIDVVGFSVMSSHFHVILRNRPDLVADYDDEEVVRRWWLICPKRRERNGSPAEMSSTELQGQLQDPARLSELRRRLSSISWLLRLWTNRLARRANKESEKRGHFWAGRFGSRRLLDEGAVLACMSYVDLNPVRAGMYEAPEQSRFTSVYLRVAALRQRERFKRTRWEGTQYVSDAWLSPIHLSETSELGGQPRGWGEPRASDKGVLPIDLKDYLAILDWTSRQFRADKRGATPEHMAPILERLGIVSDTWMETVDQWGEQAGHWVGNAERLAAKAKELDLKWVHGITFVRRAFRR